VRQGKKFIGRGICRGAIVGKKMVSMKDVVSLVEEKDADTVYEKLVSDAKTNEMVQSFIVHDESMKDEKSN